MPAQAQKGYLFWDVSLLFQPAYILKPNQFWKEKFPPTIPSCTHHAENKHFEC